MVSAVLFASLVGPVAEEAAPVSQAGTPPFLSPFAFFALGLALVAVAFARTGVRRLRK